MRRDWDVDVRAIAVESRAWMRGRRSRSMGLVEVLAWTALKIGFAMRTDSTMEFLRLYLA